MKIFGIGLSRTGTVSLTSALMTLGYRIIHYPCDLRTRAEIHHFHESDDDRIRLTLLKHVDGLTDIPVCTIYKALDRSYVGSKFILTIRDKQAWLQSCKGHWQRREAMERASTEAANYWGYVRKIRQLVYGTADYDEDAFSKIYDSYHEDIHGYFAGRAHDLLVMDITAGDGWNSLCSFLKRPLPAAMEFPRKNAAGESAGNR